VPASSLLTWPSPRCLRDAAALLLRPPAAPLAPAAAAAAGPAPSPLPLLPKPWSVCSRASSPWLLLPLLPAPWLILSLASSSCCRSWITSCCTACSCSVLMPGWPTVPSLEPWPRSCAAPCCAACSPVMAQVSCAQHAADVRAVSTCMQCSTIQLYRASLCASSGCTNCSAPGAGDSPATLEAVAMRPACHLHDRQRQVISHSMIALCACHVSMQGQQHDAPRSLQQHNIPLRSRT
jgi:hypothetical protein